jgi:hypothetical protein
MPAVGEGISRRMTHRGSVGRPTRTCCMYLAVVRDLFARDEVECAAAGYLDSFDTPQRRYFRFNLSVQLI